MAHVARRSALLRAIRLSILRDHTVDHMVGLIVDYMVDLIVVLVAAEVVAGGFFGALGEILAQRRHPRRPAVGADLLGEALDPGARQMPGI